MIITNPDFDATNAVGAKEPILLIEIDTYTRVFVSSPTGVSGQYPWITNIDPQGVTVNDLDGGADLGQLSFTILDLASAITGDFPSFVFEGKKVTLKTGFVGLAQSKFTTLFTGKIDSVLSADSNNSYNFVCSDPRQILANLVFQTGDDGFPTDSTHTRTLIGHPLDILAAIWETELAQAPADLNLGKILKYRDGIYAGYQFVFVIDSPPAAKDFIENQIMKPLGAWLWVNSKGQLDVNFFYRDNRPYMFVGSLIGAWTDGTGQLVARPFFIGNGVTLTAPTGATQLQMGVNDSIWSDNTGSWQVSVNGGASVTVDSKAAPWGFGSGINSAYPFVVTGAGSPTVVAVTAGTSYAIAYVSGLVSLHFGVDASDGGGTPTAIAVGAVPSTYAYAVFAPDTPVMTLTDSNMSGDLPLAEQADIVNIVDFKFDKSSDNNSNYLAELVETDSDSVTKYSGLYGEQVIESDGLRSGFQAFFICGLTAELIFNRYANKTLMIEGLILNWTACKLEPGDLVAMTTGFVPDRIAGVKGVTVKLFEVMDREYDYNAHTVTVKLLEFLSDFGFFLIAPDTLGDYTADSADDKATYMFLADDTDLYSNGDAAHSLG